MRSYYTGKHAINYNRTWKTFSQGTLAAAIDIIDVETLKQRANIEQRPLRLLDAGCGTGLLLERLGRIFPSAQLYGIDASTEMLAQAKQLLQDFPDVQLDRATLSAEAGAELPYPAAFFDLIICTNALHYLQEPVIVLKKLGAHLIEEGQFVLEDYVLRLPTLLWKPAERIIQAYDPQHQALFTLGRAIRLSQEADLRIVGAHTFPVGLLCKGWVIRATRA